MTVKQTTERLVRFPDNFIILQETTGGVRIYSVEPETATLQNSGQY